MRKLILTAIVLCSATIAMAQPPAGNAAVGDKYGASFNPTGAMDITAVPAKLQKNESFNGKIKAKVLDVCPKMGCWMKVQVDENTQAFVEMKDYGFFLPTAIKGKTVVLDGNVSLKTTSVDDLKHFAEDAKKSQAEIDAIKEPKKEIRIMASGITVVN